jgi:hypothetical protein
MTTRDNHNNVELICINFATNFSSFVFVFIKNKTFADGERAGGVELDGHQG